MKKRREDAKCVEADQPVLDLLTQAASEFRSPLSVQGARALAKDRLGYNSPRSAVQKALQRCPCFAKTSKNNFVTKEVLLRGAFLRIQPYREEVSKGILVPGHRFLPIWWGNDTDELTARDAEGEAIPHTEISLSYEEAFPYHYLLGSNWVANLLHKNKIDPVGEKGTFRVYYLRRFYEKTGFKAGDFLLVRIEDPWKKEIVLKRQSRSEVVKRLGKIRASDVQLESSFIKIADHPYVLWSLGEQLFHALAMAPTSVLKHPGSPLERFLQRTGALSVQEVGSEMVIFPRGMTPFQAALRKGRREQQKHSPSCNPIDPLFERFGINLRSSSLYGVLRLGAHEGSTLHETTEGLIPWSKIKALHPQEAKCFKSQLNDLWGAALEEEKRMPLKASKADLLRQAVSLKETILHVLRQLEVLHIDPASLPFRPLLKIIEIDDLADFLLQMKSPLLEQLGQGGEISDLLSDVEANVDQLQNEVLNDVLV